jgi:hypothetical protein
VCVSSTGLPDGMFSNQKSQFWYIWGGLGMENYGIFQLHSVYFAVICYRLWPFSKFCDRLEYFFRFGILCKGKSGNPVLQPCVPFRSPTQTV